MTKQTSVINISGDYEESIIQLAKHLGTNKIRRQIFNVIYGRGKKPKSKKQIMATAGMGASKSQQVTNALDILYKHHLIERIENTGFVDDGSRFVWSKVEPIRANKDKIIRIADNLKLADTMPTKRRSAAIPSSPTKSIIRKLKKKKRLVVLYLTANPDEGAPLRVDREVRLVQDAIRGSMFRDNVEVVYRPAADLDSLIEGLNDKRPQIVHFSGHGSSVGIIGDDGGPSYPVDSEISYSVLSKALAATDTPPGIVLLNSCKSSSGREELLKAAKVVITMQAEISDLAATAFAPKFYAALASGQSVKSAFEQGCVAIENVSINEAYKPELRHQPTVDPKEFRLT